MRRLGSTAAPRAPRGRRGPRPRTEIKRAMILDAAIRHFARRGFRATRVEDLAGELGIAKGSVFQHFKSKEGLFLAAWKRAVMGISTWLEVPANVRENGFFSVVRYWLEKPVNLSDEDWIQFKVGLMGTYGADLAMKKEITRYLAAHDPYGTRAFVRWGIERGEVRDDVDPDMIVSMLDWMMERYEDTMFTERLTPRLFRRPGEEAGHTQKRIEQILELLRGAIART